MEKNQSLTSKWVLILAGLVMGLILAVGFEFTHTTQAQSQIEQVVPQSVPSGSIGIAQQLSNAFANAAQEVNPSVVTIFTETDVKVQQQPFSNSPFEQFFGNDFFKKFFQSPGQQGNYKRMGLGSGVIAGANGIIYTNNHVVDGADNIKVRLMDGREFKATVKGRDPQTDLAVITIDAKDLPAIHMGNSDNLRVGDWVLAIGSPLNPQLEHTVTAGIVSAKGRSEVGLSQYEDYIQTDAAINPGNSGGALVNLNGELVGINSAIATQTGGFMGIGFAIPVNLARHVTKDLIEKGKVVRGWLGVSIQNVTPELSKALNLKVAKGVVVSSVQKESPAEKAGLKPEDVILKFNGKTLENTVELSTWVANTSPGTTVTLSISRDGKEMPIKVKLGELNPENMQLASGTANVKKMGIEVSTLTNELAQKYQINQNVKGVVITKIDPNGVGAQIGLKEGDVITQVDRKDVKSAQQFNNEIGKVGSGDQVLLYVNRGNYNFFAAFAMP
jgi:serine protease Do